MAAPELVPWINSAGEGGDRNSMQQFDGNGSQTSFDFSFAGGYIYAQNVKAYKYNLASGLTVAIDPVVLTGPSTIEVIPAPAAVNVERTVGEVLVVYRDTQKTVPLVDYATGAVMDEANLDMSNKQAVFIGAEMVDRFDSVNAGSTDAIERSFEALTKANTAIADSAAAVADAAAAVTTANDASATADAALDLAEDAVAAATGLNVDLNLYLSASANRGIVGRTGSVAVPGNVFYRIAFVDEGGSGTGGSVRFDRHNKATGAFVDSVFSLDYGGNINTYGKTMYGVAYPANNDHAANKVYVDDQKASVLTTAAGLYAQKSANLSDLASAATARTNLGVLSSTQSNDIARFRTGFLGLKGSTSGTTVSLAWNRAFVTDASGNVLSLASGSINLNLSTTGANGRDQAGNFNSQWIYVFVIWGSSVGTALVASASATPTLPTNYTHYAYAARLRVGATNNTVLATTITGNRHKYPNAVAQTGGGSATSLIGSPLSMSNLSNFVPPDALDVTVKASMFGTANGSGATVLRTTWRDDANGQQWDQHYIAVYGSAAGAFGHFHISEFPYNGGAGNISILFGGDCVWGANTCNFEINGYTIPNGAV